MNAMPFPCHNATSRRRFFVSAILAVALVSFGAVPAGFTAEPTASAGSDIDKARHQRHDRLANDFAHVDLAIPERVHSVTPATRLIMSAVIGHYLELKDALVDADIPAADQAASRMADAVARVPTFEFDNGGRRAWSQHAALYGSQLAQLQQVGEIAAKRSYLAHISEIVYCTLKSFGLAERRMFIAYCPMALDGKGAYWISAVEKIRNPYFGRAMLGCGEVRETLREYWRSPR